MVRPLQCVQPSGCAVSSGILLTEWVFFVLVCRSVAAATSAAATASTSTRFRSVTFGPRSRTLAATHGESINLPSCN